MADRRFALINKMINTDQLDDVLAADLTVTGDWTFSGTMTLGDGDWELSGNGSGNIVFKDLIGDNAFTLQDENSEAVFQVDNNASQARLRDGYKLRIHDSGDTDYGDFYHDGTHFYAAFTNTDNWNIDGADVAFRDATNATKFVIDHGSSLAWVRDGYTLRISDSGDTDYGEFYHDGTNFKAAFTNTTQFDISGAQLHVEDTLIVGSGGTITDDGTALSVQAAPSTAQIMLSTGVANAFVMRAASLVDDASVDITLPNSRQGGLVFLTATNAADAMTGEWAMIYVDDASTITDIQLSNAAHWDTGDGANNDTDGKLNVWSATAGVISIKNRRGLTRRVQLVLMG